MKGNAMSSPCPLHLTVSLDVEEEGLFGGRYAQRDVTVANVTHLKRLTPLMQEHNIPVTLFCAYSVLGDVAACEVLAGLRDRYGAEIGAHLHHWNTPPLQDGGSEYRSVGDVPSEVMEAKLHTLLEAGRRFQGAPLTSFRMGRWDMHRSLWPLLARAGVRVDASIRPLHCGRGGPDHFDAPSDPYVVQVEGAELLEVPLTCTPLFRGLPRILRGAGREVCASVQKWGALALLPVYHPLWAMRLITRLHIARGGRVISLTWHSSEMMPGGAPHMPDMAAVDRLLRRVDAYVRWLTETWPVEAVTMNELRHAVRPDMPCRTGADVDWIWSAATASRCNRSA